jgi:hypothetical protein
MSLNLRTKFVLRLPKVILLYSHNEYAPHNTTPVVAINEIIKLILKTPRSNKNSPIKLLVPGKAILDIVKNNRIPEYKGIV